MTFLIFGKNKLEAVDRFIRVLIFSNQEMAFFLHVPKPSPALRRD
jgi:hypothetical protein